MTTVDSWPVEIWLHEEDGNTRAGARLAGDGAGMTGHGLARRHPGDQEVTQTGEEIAAARARSGLAHRLLSDAAGQIEGITHQRAGLALQTLPGARARAAPEPEGRAGGRDRDLRPPGRYGDSRSVIQPPPPAR
jgi:hypothetical protein